MPRSMKGGNVEYPELRPMSVPLSELRQEVFDNAETCDIFLVPIWEDMLSAIDELEAWRSGEAAVKTQPIKGGTLHDDQRIWLFVPFFVVLPLLILFMVALDWMGA